MCAGCLGFCAKQAQEVLLLQVIKQFRDEEQEHHDIGLEHDAEAVSGMVTDCLGGWGCAALSFLRDWMWLFEKQKIRLLILFPKDTYNKIHMMSCML